MKVITMALLTFIKGRWPEVVLRPYPMGKALLKMMRIFGIDRQVTAIKSKTTK